MGFLSPASGDVWATATSPVGGKPRPASMEGLAGRTRLGPEAVSVDVDVEHGRRGRCISGTFLCLCDGLRVEEGRAEKATPLQGNPDDVGFTSLQGLSPHLPTDGNSRGEGLSDGALEEGNGMVCGDPLGHPQGHGQLAFFMFVAL